MRRQRRSHSKVGDSHTVHASPHGAARESERSIALAAVGSAAAAATFLVCALLLLLVWPAPSQAREQGFLAAAKAQAKATVAALRALTLPEFVAQVVARLKSEGVPAHTVDGGTTIVLGARQAQFASARSEPLEASRRDLESFSRALAWGLNCYVKPGRALRTDACGRPLKEEAACEQGYAPFSFEGVEFAGHADAVPFRAPSPTRNNETLALARAEEAKSLVASCLAESGESDSSAKSDVAEKSAEISLRARGSGAKEPLVEPATEGANRRVELRFVP